MFTEGHEQVKNLLHIMQTYKSAGAVDRAKKFYDKYAKGKFGRYLLKYFDKDKSQINKDIARQYVEQSQLFIEASHSCYANISMEDQ